MALVEEVPRSTHFADEADGQVAALAGGIVFAVVASTAAGAAVDVWRSRRSKGKAEDDECRQHSLPGWAVGMLLSSYALLVPGLLAHLFAARTDFVFFGSIRQNLNTYDETMVSLVRRLLHDHMYAGAVLVAFYAMAIPFLKIVLLILGQSLRRRGPANVRRARSCIKVVQAISKWACPDMFAYILLTCLMRGLDKPPSLESGMTLGLGFTCFSVFCVASTASSLGIRLPEPPAQDAKLAAPRGWACRCVGPRVAFALVMALALGFLASFSVGLTNPSMSLRMDMQLLYQVRPDLLPMAPIMDSLHLGDLLQKEVSVSECIESLWGWVGDGEVNALLALILYAGFAVMLPLVDMALLVSAALTNLWGNPSWAATASRLSRKLRKMSMLDVSVMGCLVVVLSLASLHDKGVIVSVREGTWALLFAEACRYAAAAVLCCARGNVTAAASKLEDDASVSSTSNISDNVIAEASSVTDIEAIETSV